MNCYTLADFCIFDGVLAAVGVAGELFWFFGFGLVWLFFPSLFLLLLRSNNSLFWELMLSNSFIAVTIIYDQKIVIYMHILKFWLPSLHSFCREQGSPGLKKGYYQVIYLKKKL